MSEHPRQPARATEHPSRRCSIRWHEATLEAPSLSLRLRTGVQHWHEPASELQLEAGNSGPDDSDVESAQLSAPDRGRAAPPPARSFQESCGCRTLTVTLAIYMLRTPSSNPSTKALSHSRHRTVLPPLLSCSPPMSSDVLLGGVHPLLPLSFFPPGSLCLTQSTLLALLHLCKRVRVLVTVFRLHSNNFLLTQHICHVLAWICLSGTSLAASCLNMRTAGSKERGRERTETETERGNMQCSQSTYLFDDSSPDVPLLRRIELAREAAHGRDWRDQALRKLLPRLAKRVCLLVPRSNSVVEIKKSDTLLRESLQRMLSERTGGHANASM